MSKKNSNDSESSRDSKGRFVKGARNSKATEFKKGEHWRQPKAFRNKEYLLSEYVEKGRSAQEIASEFGVTENAIVYWMDKHGIPRRTISEARDVKHWGAKGEDNPMYGRCGDKNPRWIDGSSPERQSMYARSFWKELMQVVRQRDGNKCVRCGTPNTRKNRLHAHHIKPWAGNPDARFDLSNIITLCQSCHNWVHSKENTENEYLLL